MEGVSQSIDKRIRVIIEGVGIVDTSNAIEALSRSVAGIDATRLSSMTNEIKSLGMAVNGKYDFKSFSSNIAELTNLVRGLPTDFSGFQNMALSLTPLVTAMQTISGSRFSIGTLREEISKLIELSKMDFSRLNAMSSYLRSFSSRVSGIVMPIINADSIVNALNKLANVALLPTDKLLPMAENVSQFVSKLSTASLSSSMGDSVKSVAQGIHSLASASAKDFSGLMRLPLYIINLTKSLVYLSRVPDISNIIISMRALGASMAGLSGGAMTISNIGKNLTSLSAIMAKIPTTGIKITVDPVTFADLDRLNLLLQNIANNIARIPSKMLKISIPPTATTGLTGTGGVLNKKTWVDTSGAIHGTNRALHFFRTALTTIGFTYFMKLIREAIDEFIELRSRILLTAHTIGNYREALEGVFRIANEVRASVGAMSKLFNKFHISLEPFGATVKQTTAFVKSLAQTIKISGSNTAEQKAFYVQFGQAIQSGVLRGREFRSMLESNLYMSRLLAKELAQGDLGKLKEMAFKGQLDTLTVTNAVLRNQGKINKDFERVTVTISDMYELIKNKLVETMMKWDYFIGQSNMFKDVLGWIRDNLDGIIVAVTAFVGTTMIQLLFQFKLMASILKGFAIGGIVLLIIKAYNQSERFRKSLKGAVQHVKDIWNGMKTGSNSATTYIDFVILKAKELYDTFRNLDWDLAFLSLQRVLSRIVIYIKALFNWSGDSGRGSTMDAIDLMIEKIKHLQNVITGVSPKKEAERKLRLGLDPVIYKQLREIEKVQDEISDVKKSIDRAHWQLGGTWGEGIWGKTEKEVDDYKKGQTDVLSTLEKTLQEQTDKLWQISDSYKKNINKDTWNEYFKIEKWEIEEPDAWIIPKELNMNNPATQLKKVIIKYYETVGIGIEEAKRMAGIYMDYIYESTKDLIPKPIEQPLKTDLEVDLENNEKYWDEQAKKLKKSILKSSSGIKKVIEEIGVIEQETLLTGLFTKYFKATTFTTDLTWTPDLTIKPKKVVVQDWIQIDSFKNSLVEAEDQNKEALGVYFDNLKAYWEIKEKEVTIMSKYPETAKLSEVAPKLDQELKASTKSVKELQNSLAESGIDLNEYYNQLYDVVSLVKPQNIDFTKASGMSEAEYMLSSIVDLAKDADTSISTIMNKLDTAFTDENIFKSLRELVASGVSFEIDTDFYGKIGDLKDILPDDYAKMKDEFPDIFSRAYDNADQLKDVITQIMNLYKYEDYQKMTSGDKYVQGFRDTFQELYNQYSDIIGQVTGLTKTIFEDFSDEVNIYFLGIFSSLENSWDDFARNMLKSISDMTFKMLLFGEKGIMNSLTKGWLVQKPNSTVSDEMRNQLNGLGGTAVTTSGSLELMQASASSAVMPLNYLASSANLASQALMAMSMGGGGTGADKLTGYFKTTGGDVLGSLWQKPNYAQFGGSQEANEPVWVGEKGRELFVPNTAGHIYNNTASESKTKNAQSESNDVSIVNFYDPAELDAYMNSPRGQRAIFNVMSKAKPRGKNDR